MDRFSSPDLGCQKPGAVTKSAVGSRHYSHRILPVLMIFVGINTDGVDVLFRFFILGDGILSMTSIRLFHPHFRDTILLGKFSFKENCLPRNGC